LLGTGPRGSAAGEALAHDDEGRFTGIARPSNVFEAKSESGQGSHSAPFPRALVEFFVKAFTDAGDLVFDPFLGSGTTMAAAHVLDRVGYGVEISPAYCDVILQRMASLTGEEPVLMETRQPLPEVATERGKSRPDAEHAPTRTIRQNAAPPYCWTAKEGS
ncbi:MAG TPA: site-specific DNA-methyltransferase, partial [Bryobacteraceae bacterium]|nr:site-specific DNA-methyltransferase [Bryobacteraceae bacterium]